MELHDTTRDGLRVLAADSGRETMRASLMFRVGQADETLVTRGWTHLVEHTALHGWQDPRLSFNASVGLFRTQFDLDGEREAVLEHLRLLATWLADPDLSRLDHEARVLRAEAEQRPIGPLAQAYEWRFGARGPGLVGYDEFGLSRVDPDGVRAWATSRFVADNAVLAADHVLPDDFTLPLGRGVRSRAELPPVVASTLPGSFEVARGFAAVGHVSRGWATGLAPEILRRSLVERLRHDEGAAYSPWADVERVNSDGALLVCGSDVSQAGTPGALEHVWRVVEHLGAQGPSQELLDDFTTQRTRYYRDRDLAVPSRVWSAALSVLTESEIHEDDEAERQLAAVTPQDVAALFRQFRATAIVGSPQGARRPSALSVLQAPQRAVLDEATTFRGHDAMSAVHVNDQGVAMDHPRFQVMVPWDEVAALLVFPDGARRVMGVRGWAVQLEPTLFRDGEAAVALVDSGVPASLRVPVDARAAQDVPARPSVAERWKARARAIWNRPASNGASQTSAGTFVAGAIGVFLLVRALLGVMDHDAGTERPSLPDEVRMSELIQELGRATQSP